MSYYRRYISYSSSEHAYLLLDFCSFVLFLCIFFINFHSFCILMFLFLFNHSKYMKNMSELDKMKLD